MTRQQKYKIQTIARYIILIAVGLVMIYPMIWMVGASFKATNAEIFGSIGFIPKEFTLDGYKNGWFASTYQFGRYMVNTYKFVIPKVIGTVVSSAIAAYGFSRFQFKARGFWFALMLSTLFLPQVVLNVPQFLLFTKWGWVDSYLPLVVPSFFACDTYFVFMLVQFMRGISRELEEAAEIDGCNSFKRFIYVVLPMVQPSLVSCALFQFMWSMNDFMGPLIYLNSTKKFTASLGLRMIMDTESGFDWNKTLALSVITLIPSLIIFFLAQDQFVEGIAAGGVKG